MRYGASQVMRAHRSTPHMSTSETPNFLMLGQKTCVLNHRTYHIPDHKSSTHKYVEELVEQMRTAHDMFCEKQCQLREEDFEEHPLYQVRDRVWKVSHFRGCGQLAWLSYSTCSWGPTW